MKFPGRVVIPLACLALYGEAVAMKERSHSAVSLLLRSQGPGKVDTRTVVASLNEVAKGLQTEDKKAYATATEAKAAAEETKRELTAALKKGQRSFDMATADYQKSDAQVSALQASLEELKGQITNSNTELDTLQARLKKMRQDKGLLKTGAASALRQVEAVIAKSYLRENQHKGGRSKVDKQVSSLEELSKSLSFLQETLEEDASDDETHATTEETTQKAQIQTPVLILKADKQAVVKASDQTQKGFNEEEKKIIDLIETERKKLTDLEDSLQDLQPAISNKLKQSMEINRTLDASERAMERDNALMAIEQSKGDLIETSLAEQKKTRGSAINDVLMAAKVLEHMDTALFLTKDLQGLKRAAPTFLQVSSSERHAPEHVVEQISTLPQVPLSLLQEGDGMGLEELVENYGSTMSAMEGPFDSVTKMIGGLIASLKAQANEEVNQQQFCDDSLGNNRRDRIAKKNNIDTLTSTIRWSKMAIVRLDDDVKYLDAEVARLSKAQTDEKGKLTAETTRVNKEIAEHKLADEVIAKVVVILDQLCNLGGTLIQTGSQPSLIQAKSSRAKVGSRFSQCKEASDLLKSGSQEVKTLDTATKQYLTDYTTLSGTIDTDAAAAETARTTELKSTQAARAQRASELATAQKDVKDAGKALKLIDDAKKELEHSCSHVETREEKMARRKEEIDALKEALNVLNGEAIPA